MLQKQSFTEFLKKYGMAPPNYMTNEYDEVEMIRQDLEARKNPLEDKQDDL